VLEEARIDASASSLGLEGFQKLIRQSKSAKKDPEFSGKIDFELFGLKTVCLWNYDIFR
jgi:hypothetical protein